MADAASTRFTAPVRPGAGWARWVPGVTLARHYRRAWFAKDIVAGLVLTALLVPAGMGYAEAAGLPPIHGLYASMVPLVVYFLLGPSRILVLGPDSSLAPLILAAVVPLAGADTSQRAALAAMLAILAGAFCLAAGLARLGFITDLLSLPVRYGYLNGIALTLVVGQLPKLFGFPARGVGVIEGTRTFVEDLADGLTNPTALAIGLGSLTLILVLHVVAPRVPGTLLAVVGSIAVVSIFGLADKGIALVGELPQGVPTFALPDMPLADIGKLVAAAFGIAVVSFADTAVLSRSYATKEGYEVDASQELIALGAANMASGLFQGFSVSGSASRTPVAESAGARTQVTGVVGALAIAVMLIAAPGLFRNLPSSALAAIVIAAALRLVQISPLVRLWHQRRIEFWTSIVAFAGVALFGVIAGIGIAVGVSLLLFVRRAWSPYTAELVRVDGLKGYHDARRHPEGRAVPGLLLLRFDAPLFFANAEEFRRDVRQRAAGPHPPTWLIVTAEPITDVDATAAAMLADVNAELRDAGIVFGFAELKGQVREQFERFGLVRAVGPDRFYRTVGEAVKAYVTATGTPWVDWEEREDAPGG